MGIRLSGGGAKGLRVPAAKSSGTRPTSGLVRSALFSILGDAVPGAHALDLFAGTGAMGMEALSRGAAWVDFVEMNTHQCNAIRDTLKAMDFTKHSAVYCTKAERAASVLQGPYDIIIMDPPYEMEGVDHLVEEIGISRLVAPGTLLALEHSTHHLTPEVLGTFFLAKHRRYGDTVLSIYQRGN
ncbi:MAG: 16S rRNA (guanine(966)-N(2))-methyltransferase RsmD [Dehalococcoidia bacterium]|nr:16S rRNA (guanine(966)-N(2))-methyltransferase RsmD [Dehalococcoidia bacterium]